MAKRKRLSPAQAGFLTDAPAPEVKSAGMRPPIAQQAGEAAAVSALEEMQHSLERARRNGEMVVTLDVSEVVEDHLVRDRVHVDEDEMAALIASLRSHGQRTPIEVVVLRDGRYGLISGWRRLSALRRIAAEEDAPHKSVRALIRLPKDKPDAYVSMVEENEIRAGLNHFERARIVIKSVEDLAFETEKQALNGLFGATSYARRSKIKSFIPVVRALEGYLSFPGHMSERAGLALSKALEQEGMAAQLQTALKQAAPDTAEAEAACLGAVLKQDAAAKAQRQAIAGEAPIEEGRAVAHKVQLPPRVPGASSGVTMRSVAAHRLELSGYGVTADFVEKLKAWLEEQGQ
jgi:ParB/RepB/Spo0J family partition protein